MLTPRLGSKKQAARKQKGCSFMALRGLLGALHFQQFCREGLEPRRMRPGSKRVAVLRFSIHSFAVLRFSRKSFTIGDLEFQISCRRNREARRARPGNKQAVVLRSPFNPRVVLWLCVHMFAIDGLDFKQC